ncbi:Zinc finger CCCH domain-containing protein 2 [Linum perenne]
MTTAAAAICSDHHRHRQTILPPRKLLLNLADDDNMAPPFAHLHKHRNNDEISLAHFHKHLPCNNTTEDEISLGHFYKHLPCNNEDEISLGHFYKHLPCNNTEDGDDGDGDPYSSDQFRMYDFKVRRCTRSRSHDWTDCPFAHPGEKARRRDPMKFHYTGTVCPEFRRGGGCGRGDNCEFAHGVFECWLHPSRYRTEACKDGKACKRKVCFFAHSPRQLRLLPPEKTTARKVSHHRHHCCGSGGGSGSSAASASAASSPTSTLIGLSHLSPPLSPSFSSSPPLSPVSSRHPIHRPSKFQSRFTSYKDVLAELMSSLEAMNFSEEAAAAMVAAAATAAASSPTSAGGPVNFNGGVSYGDDNSNYQQFVMSPSTPNYSADPFTNGDYFSPKINGGDRRGFGSFNERVVEMNSGDQNDVGLGGNAGGSESDPDLGWVNELLM